MYSEPPRAEAAVRFSTNESAINAPDVDWGYNHTNGRLAQEHHNDVILPLSFFTNRSVVITRVIRSKTRFADSTALPYSAVACRRSVSDVQLERTAAMKKQLADRVQAQIRCHYASSSS